MRILPDLPIGLGDGLAALGGMDVGVVLRGGQSGGLLRNGGKGREVEIMMRLRRGERLRGGRVVGCQVGNVVIAKPRKPVYAIVVAQASDGLVILARGVELSRLKDLYHLELIARKLRIMGSAGVEDLHEQQAGSVVLLQSVRQDVTTDLLVAESRRGCALEPEIPKSFVAELVGDGNEMGEYVGMFYIAARQKSVA